MIDTLKASQQLKRDGFSESQAQSIVNIVANRDEQLATKSDIDNVNKRISLLQWMIGLCLTGIIALLILFVQIA